MNLDVPYSFYTRLPICLFVRTTQIVRYISVESLSFAFQNLLQITGHSTTKISVMSAEEDLKIENW
jgi:hypothetical protein